MHPIEKFVNFNRCFVLRLQQVSKRMKEESPKGVKQENTFRKVEKKALGRRGLQNSVQVKQETTPTHGAPKQKTTMEDSQTQTGNISSSIDLNGDVRFSNLCKNESFVHRNFAEVKTSTLKKQRSAADRTFNASDQYHQKAFASSKNSNVVPRDSRIRKGITRSDSYKEACDNNSITEVQELKQKTTKVVKSRKSKKSGNKNININVTCNIKLPPQIFQKRGKMVSTEVQTDYVHFENFSSTPLGHDFNSSIEEWSMERFIKPNCTADESDSFSLENKNYQCRIGNLEQKIKKRLNSLKKLISDYK